MLKRAGIGIVSGVAILFSVTSASAFDGKKLGTSAMKRTLTGSAILIPTPLGGGFKISYARGGRMNGSSSVFSLNSAWGSKDTGKWWVRKGQLCQKWENWYKGKPYCFDLRFAGEKIHWTRNDGLSGKAKLLK